jgi:hypothetical protein
MDSRALFAAIFGAAFGALISYSVVKRRWWKAVGIFAMGGMILLVTVTEGNRSHLEHNVVFGAELILVACFAIAVVADARVGKHHSNPTGPVQQRDTATYPDDR